MNFSQNKTENSRRYGGFGLVAAAHILLAYALITSLAHTTRDILTGPVEVKIVDEKSPPPPLDLPPPSPPLMVAPPPPFIPAPEVTVQRPPENTISAVTTVPPAQPQQFTKTVPVIAPPAPIPTPPIAAHLPPVPAFSDLNSCKPSYPRASLLAEEEGIVRVQFVIGESGQLVDAKVVKSSGYNNLDKATVEALSRCKFKPAYRNGKAVQSSFLSDYVWHLGE